VSPKKVELSTEFMELARGIEPPTCGLQNRCSAIELRQPARNITHLRARCQPAGGGVCPNCARGVAASRPECRICTRSRGADRCFPFCAQKFSLQRIEARPRVPYF